MTITTNDLRDLLGQPAVQLLDVRLSDDFAAAHVAGATNNCVFEVAFSDRLSDSAPHPDSPVVVYGTGPDSHESRMAAEKLERLGYTEVIDYRDGITGWKNAGFPLETGAPLPVDPPAPRGTIGIDCEESRIGWTGRNLINKHHGSVPIQSGSLSFENGSLTGGELVLDLKNIVCDDLDGQMHDILIAHLQDDDFFDVARHPTARIVITGSAPVEDAGPGAPNLEVSADLTLRGQTQPITFAIASGLTPEGKPAAQATVSIERTRWGVLYGSGKLFHRLAGHLVNDLIDFDLRILTK
jgi:rhodanese-related sulfurtransferase/polyisoprenoid-binding protein YceI